MGPARLAAILPVLPPAEAWAPAALGRPWRQTEVLLALGARADSLIERWRNAARASDPRRRLATSRPRTWRSRCEASRSCPSVLVGDLEPPAVLFHRGDPGVIGGPRVAIVGTRQCSATGAGVAFELGRDLARAGVVVVSGLASGIDGAAHPWCPRRGTCTARGHRGQRARCRLPRHQGPLWKAVGRTGVLLSEPP